MPLTLSCHPDHAASAITGVEVQLDCLAPGCFAFRYHVHGMPDQLLLPEPAPPERTDCLWQKTCFEAFVAAPGRSGYLELNFCPSSQWAVYAFENYREDMSNPALASAPRIETAAIADNFELVARVDLGGLPLIEAASLQFALAAVIEEKNGRKSLWALNHPLGSPDFHNRECFSHKLEVTKS